MLTIIIVPFLIVAAFVNNAALLDHRHAKPYSNTIKPPKSNGYKINFVKNPKIMWVEEKIDVDNIQFNECLDSLCGDTNSVYPENFIDEMVKDKNYEELNGHVYVKTIDTANRHDPESIKSNLCPTEIVTMYPKGYLNKATNEKILIANTEYFQQEIRMERCVESTTNRCTDDKDFAIQKICKQEYLLIPMVVLGDNGKNLDVRSVEIPSGCVCAYKHNYASRRRINHI